MAIRNPLSDINTHTSFDSLSSLVCYNPYKPIGRYKDIHCKEVLLERLKTTNPQELKFLPRKQLWMYRAYIGVGYKKRFRLDELKLFADNGVIDKNEQLKLVYLYGNIFAYLDVTDKSKDFMLCDETYLIVQESSKELWNIQIGQFVLPNNLYLREDLHGVRVKIKDSHLIHGLNSVIITEKNNFFETNC